jgi:diguanylate cyclase (GGDEF)-like protein
MRITTHAKLFLSHFAAILLVSGSVGTYFYSNAADSLKQSLQSRLRNSAALVSRGFDADRLDLIRTPADAELPFYREQVAALRDLVRANPDIAFLYVMRRENDRVYFVLDSDLDEPAAPGEEYPHRIPALLEGFVRPSVDDEITADRWGYFLSGYSPLDGGEGQYLIGIDMRADEVQAKFDQIRLAGLLSLMFSLLLAMVFSNLLSKHFTRRISGLSQRCTALAGVAPDPGAQGGGDELDALSRTFDLMTDRLADKQREVEASQRSLRRARDEMEQRVEERTAELSRANELLREEVNERRRIEQVLERLSRTDYLTKVLNRRAMAQRLEQEIARCQRTGHGFCLILMDVDHFKRINDAHGHDAGDAVLTGVAERLRASVREADELARWGGEEFLILLPETRLDEAQELAERLRRVLAESAVGPAKRALAVTGSFGLAEYRGGEDLDACVKRADEALYRAKGEGRDRVVPAPGG